MSTRDDVTLAIRRTGVVGIIRAVSAEVAEHEGDLLLRSGIETVEVSLVTPGALDAIRILRRSGLGFVGAGTVVDAADAEAAVRAGAQFLVAPNLDDTVIRIAARNDLAVLPGVATPTEAIRARDRGADLIKLFPASMYGPAAIKDLLAALPALPLVPTGGVGLDQAADYIRSGAVAVGMGSALTASGDGRPEVRIRRLLDQIREARIR
ncbi:bifunctional 4-hydroxy-2-oxoglutarate aldolase/2-dehydro-3-deoxy-phosphogluconate aldolase [Leifsonia naganoensis]|uniref:2-dehydro-3-deoxyphosphogluconate aldolase/(4S)-4-hydroxy-2-oxoglutarate aldolase n=1 Tax=Leifsonia naganoensis TaxID=150025 RepID=A0A853DT56_9MICO|nr:bifunctional 4-hydroxy-2-oxoglutarate aldolase/2-dehydro-3-deoxy-phosphogluconate aldolase [Leifsonia naganoensis]NYK09561.1 2-dehydro-3-deoxyphosphogluconate aldolase/(4S)-4-hydroxy-2-oxoglutarate aldolase [Leifsonia naganoensis]